MRVIRRFARDVAERFVPDKIILFGSHAYGKPHADSDVDILVIMPTRNQLDQAVKIELECDPPFPLDIIVRTPHNVQWRLAEGESFLREITTKGRCSMKRQQDATRSARHGMGRRAPSGALFTVRKSAYSSS